MRSRLAAWRLLQVRQMDADAFASTPRPLRRRCCTHALAAARMNSNKRTHAAAPGDLQCLRAIHALSFYRCFLSFTALILQHRLLGPFLLNCSQHESPRRSAGSRPQAQSGQRSANHRVRAATFSPHLANSLADSGANSAATQLESTAGARERQSTLARSRCLSRSSWQFKKRHSCAQKASFVCSKSLTSGAAKPN